MDKAQVTLITDSGFQPPRVAANDFVARIGFEFKPELSGKGSCISRLSQQHWIGPFASRLHHIACEKLQPVLYSHMPVMTVARLAMQIADVA